MHLPGTKLNIDCCLASKLLMADFPKLGTLKYICSKEIFESYSQESFKRFLDETS